MDPEQTFLRVHARLAGMLSQLLTPRICRALEYILLGIAVALFGLLVVMHMNFVQQPGCSTELSKIDISAYQLVQIKITRAGLWSEDVSTKDVLDFQNDDISAEKTVTFNGSRRKSIFKSWKSEKEFKDSQVDHVANSHITGTPQEADSSEDEEPSRCSFLLSKRESIKAAVIYVFSNCRMQCCNFWKTLKQFSEWARQQWNAVGWHVIRDIPKFFQVLRLQQIQLLLVQWLERGGKTSEPNYLFTFEKGYFLLPEGAKSLHNIRMVNISISAHHSCFGNRWQRLLISSLVGYDTIMMNSLLSSPGKGYIYSSQTEEFYSLGYGVEQSVGSARFVDYLVTKCSVLIMSLFVFFTTTMSVSFTLRETQSRMLKFTVQLQHHARHNLPTFQLIFVHVIESLVFVPIMIGILFFLFEFYDDQMLAFLVLALVWLCELFTMISVRTPISMQFFPRFFLLYFLVFHIYFFSYSYGFSYLALFTTAAFMQHLILYFWNHYEVPALRRFMRNRSHLQQQGGVHITSSTIVTSTLHIARVNLRNQGVDHNGPQMGLNLLEPNSEELPENTTLDPLPAGNSNSIPSLQFPELNMQQATGASNTSFLNPFGSMLLSLLGGASSEGLISFFSMFRDLRDPNQVYAEEQHHDDAPAM